MLSLHVMVTFGATLSGLEGGTITTARRFGERTATRPIQAGRRVRQSVAKQPARAPSSAQATPLATSFHAVSEGAEEATRASGWSAVGQRVSTEGSDDEGAGC